MSMFGKDFKHKNSSLVFILRMLFGLVLFDEKNIFIKKTDSKISLPPALSREINRIDETLSDELE